jgi:hypothetical protein
VERLIVGRKKGKEEGGNGDEGKGKGRRGR